MRGIENITCKKMREMLLRVAEEVMRNVDYLTDLDRACGDGDFGIGMYRGFTAAEEVIQAYGGDDLGELLTKLGLTIMSSVGGASGPVFGALFSTAGMRLKGRRGAWLREIAEALKSSLDAVMRLGGAGPGDKTLVDALAPAVEALEESSRIGEGLREALRKAAEAAERGAEATRNMVARKGKASYLGDKTLGHPDPGAVAVSIILKTISESI